MKVPVLFTLILLSFFAWFVNAATLEEELEAQKCECAVFNSNKITVGMKPLITQKVIPTGCDARGEKDCLDFCTNLAQLSRARGPEIICTHLGHADKVMLSVFSRVCNKENWSFTGISCEHELCCHDSKPIDCKTGKVLAVPKINM